MNNKTKENPPKTSFSSALYYPLPYKHIEFQKGRVLFSSPYREYEKQGMFCKWSKSEESFNLIKDAIKKIVPSVFVELYDGHVMQIHNFDELTKAIITLTKEMRDAPKMRVKHKPEIDVAHKPIKMTLPEVSRTLAAKSSTYIKRLCKAADPHFPVFYCTESMVHSSSFGKSEEVFAFIIQQKRNRLAVVFENVNNDRATMLFVISNYDYGSSIEYIHKFLVSNFQNKRQSLASRKLTFDTKQVLKFSRVPHNSYSQWGSAIDDWVRSMLY